MGSRFAVDVQRPFPRDVDEILYINVNKHRYVKRCCVDAVSTSVT